MLPITPFNSTVVTLRNEPTARSQPVASSRRPFRIRAHSASSTTAVFHALSQAASANGFPPSRAQRFISDKPNRRCSAWAAIVAPPARDCDAPVADNLSSDRSKPMSPELSTYAPPAFAPSISSDRRVVRESPMSGVCIRFSITDRRSRSARGQCREAQWSRVNTIRKPPMPRASLTSDLWASDYLEISRYYYERGLWPLAESSLVRARETARADATLDDVRDADGHTVAVQSGST